MDEFDGFLGKRGGDEVVPRDIGRDERLVDGEKRAGECDGEYRDSDEGLDEGESAQRDEGHRSMRRWVAAVSIVDASGTAVPASFTSTLPWAEKMTCGWIASPGIVPRT